MNRVLAIDDSRSMRQMLAFILEREGYQVDTEAEPSVALGLIDQNQYALIICDVNMPNMDGYQFVQEARKKNRSRYTPILMIAADSSPAQKARAREAGATGWLAKPFNPDRFVVTVRKAICQ
ncbi:MAG: response regulator [Proteobacteria bacterium]|nr:MAG: response regulator [Pseudomonadota bacterium]PIE40046.1 MAG: response regulator [Gammaproteobacteria bacterium]